MVVAQRRRGGITRTHRIAGQEVVPKIFAAQELQIHGQKGGVVDAVEVAKLVFELQAIQQRRFAIHQEDVIGQ